jgi:low affinity Fe/Cu permease
MPRSSASRRRLAYRTEQLPASSRQIYRIDHYTSQSWATMVALSVVTGLLVAGAVVGFPGWWVTLFSVGTSAVTLIMVFIIQHTASREQAATQRKLDELLRAVPQAADSLMLLEEAPEEVVRGVEEEQRAVQRTTRG